MLFINADREYREGKAQNFLRPEDIDKIVHAYRNHMADCRATYPPRFPGGIEAEGFNSTSAAMWITPPARPHDVRAHLTVVFPLAEIDALAPFLDPITPICARALLQLREESDAVYADFSEELTEKRDIANLINNAPPAFRPATRPFMQTTRTTGGRSQPAPGGSPGPQPAGRKRGNVYALRRGPAGR